jgi:prophage antirepressor-like protein
MTGTTGALAPTPSVFNFRDHPVRIIMRDGEPWFVCSDVAEALGYRNAPDAARNLADNQKASTQIVRSTSGGNPNITIINESGLYRLVLRSRKPEALPFSDWVTGEVLPSIRKTGSYSKSDTIRIDPAALLLSGQSTPTVPHSPTLTKAIERRSWDLAHEAYELIREHLTRRATYHGECGWPRELNETEALAAIEQGDLGEALAHAYFQKLKALRSFVETNLRLGQQLLDELTAIDKQSEAQA